VDEIHSDDYRGVVNQSCSKLSVNVGGRVDKFFHEVMQVAILTGSVLYLSTVLLYTTSAYTNDGHDELLVNVSCTDCLVPR